MDPLRLVVALVALVLVGGFAFLAANGERQVDAGSAVGFVSDDVAAASTRAEVDGGPAIAYTAVGVDPLPGGVLSGGDAEADGDNAQPVFPDPADKVRLTDKQWRDRLSAAAYHVLRRSGTERPFSSPLDGVKEPGWFTCAGCGNLLFETKTKYDSGTGWPSFWAPVAARHVVEEEESGLDTRIEVRCARCDGHLGHVFQDGPREETGLRYCMNGVAMAFTAK
ncbi:peptide-methionine (R)-S-oxide reductase MsrB [Phycisphaera mikurensis]|uniref:peptide-methionine (R)-S-oxide reductase n=1 Tax=Phycisphaera mikurensis (strain NBRC 102666 / KCTC 22515 / FYK2301M01) TaxID=1142394 RepID=I0IAH3_PHYMF|nr:peptide-methionine (R)-S-oxide reductase MsrB [Phycisphaera mikurensis]MBB6441742.1 peptide-methionine (R)-S-oxide reductase [Phycisphaera mikurensis]BAM02261.1 peptide methionine sulfoxide reductase MsrB [Phycisphaera mikurensis NBRC 102666]